MLPINKITEFANKEVKSILPKIIRCLDYLWKNQKEETQSYGDIDFSFTKIECKDKKVLFLKDNVTTSAFQYCLFVWSKEGCHIRTLYEDNSDYKKSKYTSRPNLQYYKDRGFDFEYRKEWQFTELGGCYGDGRDEGYLLSFSDWAFMGVKDPEHRYQAESVSLSTLERLYLFLLDLESATKEIKESKNVSFL